MTTDDNLQSGDKQNSDGSIILKNELKWNWNYKNEIKFNENLNAQNHIYILPELGHRYW